MWVIFSKEERYEKQVQQSNDRDAYNATLSDKRETIECNPNLGQ